MINNFVSISICRYSFSVRILVLIPNRIGVGHTCEHEPKLEIAKHKNQNLKKKLIFIRNAGVWKIINKVCLKVVWLWPITKMSITHPNDITQNTVEAVEFVRNIPQLFNCLKLELKNE